MNKKFVYQVGNNKKSYTMMHGQPTIKINKLVVRIATGYTFHNLHMQLAPTSSYNTQTLYKHREYTFN